MDTLVHKHYNNERQSTAQQADETRDPLLQARIDLLYRQSPFALTISFLIALISAFILWPVVDDRLLSLWLLALSLITAARVLLLRYHRRLEQDAGKAYFWKNLFTCLTFLSGICWGLLALLIEPDWPLGYQIYIPFVLGGLCAGAISSNSASLLSYAAFLIPALSPLGMVMLLNEGLPDQAMGLLVFLYMSILWILASGYHQTTLESLGLRHENSVLLRDLKKQNKRLKLESAAREHAYESLRQSRVLAKSAFDKAAIPMALVDREGNLLKVNQAVCDLGGYSSEELIGKSFTIFTHPEDLEESHLFHRQLFAGKRDHYIIKKRYLRRDGEQLWTTLIVSIVRDAQGEPDYMIAQIQDVTEAHQLSEQLTYQARHDPLTGLINRHEFERRVQNLLQPGTPARGPHAMCYIDLDQFKLVNDTCGHIAGDELLKQVTAVMQQRIRRHDALARLGGDEFGLLMEDCPLEVARRIADDLRAEVEAFQFHWDKLIHHVGVSIGLVAIDADTQNMTELFKQADSACYAAKDGGRNRIHVYREDDVMLATREGEMQWVSRINKALKDDSFELYAQTIAPIGDCDGAMRHFEILLRMRQEDGALIPPGAFLPAVERYNLSSRLDAWVVGSILRILSEQADICQRTACCAINLSGQTLGNRDFLEYVCNTIREFDVSPDILCFEITETAAISNLSDATHFINHLKELGCRFALDDFGSGLSSFAYLKNLPVDYLKIDGMFVRDVLTDPIDLAMVRSINDIGHVMGKETIAEFVENDEILAKLREIGVDYAQGYGVGRPEPFC